MVMTHKERYTCKIYIISFNTCGSDSGISLHTYIYKYQGRIQDFKLGGGGAHLNKLRRAEGGANIFGVFRVKNHDFTPKNHIFSNFRGGGARRVRPPPPLDPPLNIYIE